LKVLFADDAAELRLLHGELVTHCGHEAVFASDGEEAWDILRGPESPQVALLDWVMPKIDGVEFAHIHHDKYNGNGYPRGIAGDHIAQSERIVALADVYDALRTRRPYKEPWPHQKVIELIQSESGAPFDPQIVEAFNPVAVTFATVSKRWQDTIKEESAS